MEKRRPDAEKYIHPQKKYADLIIRYYDAFLLEDSKDTKGLHQPGLGVEFVMDVSIDAEPVLALLQELGVHGSLSYDNDLLHQRIIFKGEDLAVEKEVWEKTAHTAVLQMEDLTGGHIIWEDGANGLVQLVLLVVIGEIMKRK